MADTSFWTRVNNAIKTLSTKPGIRGSEAYRAIVKTVKSQQSLGKTISGDVRRTIVESLANLGANITVQKGQEEQTNREVARTNANTSSFAQQQLDSLLKSMYNQGEEGQGQSGSTTDISSKGGG